MAVVLQPWQVLVASFAGWLTRQQDAVIEYLREQNRVLRQQLGRKRLRRTDNQRHRLALKDSGVEIVRLPPQSPDLNVFAERPRAAARDEGDRCIQTPPG